MGKEERSSRHSQDSSSTSSGRGKCESSDLFLILVLQLVELVVEPFLRKKFLVGSLFPDPAAMHDQDAVGVLDGGKTMRDDNGGSPASGGR